MTHSHDDTLLTGYSREDAARLADLMLSAQQPRRPGGQLTVEVIEVIDLDLVSSSLAGITDPIGQLKSWLEDTLKQIADWIVNSLRGVLEPILDALRQGLDWLSSTIQGIADAIRGLYDLFQQVVLDPIINALDWVSSNFPRIVDAVSQLFSQIGEFLAEIPQRIAEIASQIASMITDAVRGAVEAVSNLIGQIVDMISRLPEMIADAVSRVAETIGSAVSSFVDMVRDAVSTVMDWLSRLPQLLSDAVSTVVDVLRGVIDTLVDQVRGFLQTIGDLVSRIPQMIADAISSAINAVTGFVQQLSNIFTNLINTVADWLGRLPQMIGEIISRIQETIAGIASAISSALQGVLNFIQQIPQMLANAVQTVFQTVSGFISTLTSMFTSAFQTVANWIAQIPQMITSVVQTIVNFIQTGMQTVANLLQNIVSTVADWIGRIPQLISQAIQTVIDFISNVASRIQELFTTVINTVVDFIQGLPQLIANAIQTVTNLLQRIPQMVADFIQTVVDFIQQIPQMLSNVFSQLIDMVQGAIKTVTEGLKTVWDILSKLPKTVQDAVNAFFRLLEEAHKRVTEVFKWIHDRLNDIVKLVSSVPEIVRKVVDTVSEFLSNLPRYAAQAVENVEQWIWEHLPDWVKSFLEQAPKALETVANAFQGFINAILKFPEWFPVWFEEHLVKPFTGFLSEFFKPVIGFFDNASRFLSQVGEALQQVGVTVWNELQNLVSDPIGWLKSKADVLANMIKSMVKLLVDRLAALMDVIVEAFAPHSPSILEVVARAIGRFIGWVVAAVSKVIPVAAEGIGKLLSPVARALESAARSGPVNRLVFILSKPWASGLLAFLPTLVDLLTLLAEGRIRSPLEFLYELVNRAILASVGAIMLSTIFKTLSAPIEGVNIYLNPLGLGARIRIRLGELVKMFSETIEKAMPEVAKYLIIGHMIWWAEPTRALTRRILAKSLTIELPPIETTVNALRRRLYTPRRDSYYEMFVDQLLMGGIYKGFIDSLWPLPRKLIEDIGKRYPQVLKTYDAELDAVWVRDRWGARRLFPASLVFEIPTPSELARMMIRDIIQDPVFFAAVMGMHGFHPDNALMYYLLHFRYPSPEKLAEFFWRGIAGELWNPDKSYDKRMAEVFFPEGGAPKPVAPKELNFDAEKLFEMLKTYMKWHDYSRLPWQSGWPTDNAIVMDLLADIPGKIDLRWMTRWGLFDYWGAYGAKVTTTIEEITKTILQEGAVASAAPMVSAYSQMLATGKIVFDVRQFARALQATGLHPYWVPWISIAETINALTEERTLLRTGFMNLFREGLWSLDRLNDLLSGFFTVVFKTGYFDPSEMRWKEVDVEYPVAFLPAESKLLELRALMDKALDIFREAYRYLIRSALQYTIGIDEAREYLNQIRAAINTAFFVKEMERIAGQALPLELDEGYWTAWKSYVEVLQKVEARERTRFYARYLIWSVLWGLRWGYTTYEEAEEWINNLVKIMHEHEYVRQAIRLSVDFMLQRFYKEAAVRRVINLLRSRRITVDDAIAELRKLGFSEEDAKLYIESQVLWYTPSLTTYATMLEIVPEALSMSLKAIEAFNLPADEKPYWQLYMVRKTIQDELTLLRTRIYNALAEGMSHEELIGLLDRYLVLVKIKDTKVSFEGSDYAKKLLALYDEHRSTFQAYGIAPHEWVLYNLIAHLERRIDELRQAARERIPTPSTMAVLAEYLVLPEDLVRETLERYHVAPEWLPYWLQYIRVKPLKSNAKQLLTAYFRAYRYGAVTRDELEDYIKKLAEYGFTPTEIDLIMRRVDLEEAVLAAREYYPTPSTLATLSEYLVLPEDLILKALRARRVPEEWARIWLQYIRVRPIKSDARSLLSAYIRAMRYGVVTPDEVKKYVESLQEYGFTPKEIELVTKRVELEEAIAEARELRRSYLPTPYMLATLSEYVQVPPELVAKVLQARRVPEEWVELWLRFIRVRPLADEARLLATAYYRAKRYGVPLGELEQTVLDILRQLGFSEEELRIRELRATIEAMIDQWREAQRAYIPTPSMLATIAEYVPAARRLATVVFEARRVPEEWRSVWLQYIKVRPIADELRRYVTAVLRLYEYFAVKEDEVRRTLEKLLDMGYERAEIDLLLQTSRLNQALRAYRELVGTPRQLVTLAEYSPTARQVALAQVHKMIDALPVDPQTKEFLKKMWEEYIRVRPVYDEVRRYVTELINDYARGVIDRQMLESELDELRQWGLDDYEIQFYLWLAEKRRARYARTGY